MKTENEEKERLSTKLSEKEKASAKSVLSRKKELKACLSCGGTKLRVVPATKDQTSLSVAQKPDVYGAYSCSDCGHQGAPIIFKSPAAYEKFFVSKRQKYNMRLDQQEAHSFLANGFLASGKKEPGLAFILNLVFPGLGYSYLGQRKKAWGYIMFIGIYLIGVLLLTPYALAIGLLPFILYFFLVFFSSLDAYLSAKKLQAM